MGKWSPLAAGMCFAYIHAGFWSYFSQCKEGGAGGSLGCVKKPGSIAVEQQEPFSQTACPPPPLALALLCMQDRQNGLGSEDCVLRIEGDRIFYLP